MSKINKKSLSLFIEERYGDITKGESENIINSLFWKIEQELRQGNDVSIVGFGKFYIKKMKPRICTNPQTGEKFNQPAREVIKFKAGKNIKSITDKK